MKKGFGELFSESWKEYAKNFKVFFILILLFAIIPSVVIFIFNKNLAVYSILSLISLVLYFILSVSLVYFSLYNKKAMTYGKALSGGLNYFWRFLGFSIVLIIFLALLFLLLIVPGIIFLIYWMFASYILIGENTGIMEAFSRSKQLVRGRWWMVFGYFLLFSLIMLGFNMILGIPSLIIGSEILILITGSIFNLIYLPLSVLFFKNFYLSLKKKEK